MRLALLATVVLCAGALTSAASAEPPDPCVLITVKDAAPVFGATPHKPTAKTAGGARSCTFSLGHKTMTVQTRTLASATAFAASIKALRGLVLPIASLSDAYSAENGKEMLLWKKGAEITFLFVGLNPVFATQQTLATTALGRV
jgi:hypothetical protein